MSAVMETERVCRECSQCKPIEDFRLSRGHRYLLCMTCERAQALARYHAGKAKVCHGCMQMLAWDQFPMRLRRGEKKPRHLCIACQKVHDAARYKARNHIGEDGVRPVYFRAEVEQICDAAMKSWVDGPVTQGPLTWRLAA